MSFEFHRVQVLNLALLQKQSDWSFCPLWPFLYLIQIWDGGCAFLSFLMERKKIRKATANWLVITSLWKTQEDYYFQSALSISSDPCRSDQTNFDVILFSECIQRKSKQVSDVYSFIIEYKFYYGKKGQRGRYHCLFLCISSSLLLNLSGTFDLLD